MSKLCKRFVGATFVIFLLILASKHYLNRSSQLFFKVSELDEQPLGDSPVNGMDDLPQLPKWLASGATSRTFTGIKSRTFPRENVRFQFFSPKKSSIKRLEPWCQKWGVLTTIFKVSKAVHQQVQILVMNVIQVILRTLSIHKRNDNLVLQAVLSKGGRGWGS